MPNQVAQRSNQVATVQLSTANDMLKWKQEVDSRRKEDRWMGAWKGRTETKTGWVAEREKSLSSREKGPMCAVQGGRAWRLVHAG